MLGILKTIRRCIQAQVVKTCNILFGTKIKQKKQLKELESDSTYVTLIKTVKMNFFLWRNKLKCFETLR